MAERERLLARDNKTGVAYPTQGEGEGRGVGLWLGVGKRVVVWIWRGFCLGLLWYVGRLVS